MFAFKNCTLLLIFFLKQSDGIFYQEKRLCCEFKLSPTMHLKLQEDMSVQRFDGSVSSKSDAHQMLKNMVTMRIDRVYDMLIKKGIGSP